MEQSIILNNKKSKKIGYKRKDALIIAGQIKQFLADRGILLPHASSGVFGRGFQVTPSLKTQVSREIHQEHDLRNSLDHLVDYQKHVTRRTRALRFIPYTGQLAPFNWNQTEARRYWYKILPIPFDRFTEKRYIELKRDRIKEYRKEHSNKCVDGALPVFTDQSTGELLFDEYNQLARAHYALWQNSPAAYALFKHPVKDHFSSHGIVFTCSKHRIDPVWNYLKSKKLRSSIHSWMKSEKVHEHYQPMHLVLTVPHPGGVWTPPKSKKPLTFYAKEMVSAFNLLRKTKAWNKYIYGGLLCLEITRKGANGLHIHIHAMVLQRPEYDRNEVHDYISSAWEQLTGGTKCWYETLYIHRKANPEEKNSAWILETDDYSNKVWDQERQEYKKKKFYLDTRYDWFNELSEEEKFNTYVSGVLECVKYHFKYESFKTGRKLPGTNTDEWDIQLIADVLRYSKNLRMYDKFGKLYGVKELGMNYIEDQAVSVITDQSTALNDGVENQVINPFTKQLAVKGEYTRVLALPHYIEHYGQYQNFRPVNLPDHDIYFEIKEDIPIRNVVAAVMKKNWEDILSEKEYARLRDCNYKFIAPREKICWGAIVNEIKRM